MDHKNGKVNNKIEDDDKGRETVKWSSKLDFYVTLLGYSFGLPDIWRLPYLAYRNGGGLCVH